VSTKHANLGIVRQLAWEFAPHIQVNGVAVGVARTAMEGLRSLNQWEATRLLFRAGRR